MDQNAAINNCCVLVTGICFAHCVRYNFWLLLPIKFLSCSRQQEPCELLISVMAVCRSTTLFELAYNDVEVGGVKVGAFELSVNYVVKEVTELGDVPKVE